MSIPNVMSYTLPQFEKDIDALVTQLNENSKCPDLIIGLSRGGLVPAVRLSHRLGVPLRCLHYNTRDHVSESSASLVLKEIKFIIDMVKSGKRVLLVDDIVDSGKTVSAIKQLYNKILDVEVEDQDQLEGGLEFGCLIYNVDLNFVPEYYVNEISRSENDDWILFWWEEEGIAQTTNEEVTIDASNSTAERTVALLRFRASR